MHTDTVRGPPSLLPSSGDIPDAEHLGVDFGSYRPSYDFAGAFIDATHAGIAALPVANGLISSATQGFLRPQEALTLYECAYFATGDVLEIGSAWGLSTSFLCAGVERAGGSKVISIERDRHFSRLTQSTVVRAGLGHVLTAIEGDGAVESGRLIAKGQRFAMAFIDHDHSLAAVRAMCALLPELMAEGSLVLFHDYNDVRNTTEPHPYGVYTAVGELLDGGLFGWQGLHGSMAMLRKLVT